MMKSYRRDGVNQGRKKPSSNNSILTAAALQDHLTRQYSLTNCLPSATSVKSKGRGNAGTRSKAPTTTGEQPNGTRIIKKNGKVCSTCGLSRNIIHSSTSLKQSKISPRTEKEEEYVLDKAPPSLTLAQRLGLIGAPPPLLSDESWKVIKESSNTRHDSTLPCPICQESFDLSTQVLLSCSHVFHLSCLTSFERFTRRKRCPLCRTDNYQKRVIFEGANYWRHRAATIIQSQWRGYVLRKWYKSYRDQVPPSDPELRTKHFEKKLSTLTEMMVESCDKGNTQAESILAQSDANMSAIRDAFELYDLYTQPAEVDWNMLYAKSQDHLSTDCSICLGPLVRQSSNQCHNSNRNLIRTAPCIEIEGDEKRCLFSEFPSSSHSPIPNTRPVVKGTTHHRTNNHHLQPLSLLSCGHLLHVVCIEALERFASEGTLHLCPLCRAPYQRITIELYMN